MNASGLLLVGVGFLLLLFLEGPEIVEGQPLTFDGSLVSEVKPYEVIKYQHVMKQEWDESCGFAVLATFMNTYYGLSVSEATLIQEARDHDFFVLESKGRTNLLMLKKLLLRYDFVVSLYRLNIEQLHEAVRLLQVVPLHFEKPEKHFVLVLGKILSWWVVGDPSIGVLLLSDRQLERRWSGYVMAVEHPERSVDQTKLHVVLSTFSQRVHSFYE